MLICTGLHPAGYELYGRDALETFDRYWPTDVQIVCYTEEPVAMPRGECRPLWDIPGAIDIEKRFRDDPIARGLKPGVGCKWSEKDHNRARGGKPAWRFDAWKWFRQCIIPRDASLSLQDGEVLCWLDGDVISYREVPNGFVEGLLGKFDMVYLGRQKHRTYDPDRIGSDSSEIGFWAVRLNKKTRLFLDRFADTYRDRSVFGLAEYHSAYVFDVWRRRLAASEGLQARDLTPGGSGHTWARSPLAKCLDHLKGDRKNQGFSKEIRGSK